MLAFLGIAIGFTIGSFGNPQRLRADGQPRAIHQRHGIAHQAKAAFSNQFGRRIVVLDLAGGRGMDAQLVLDAADVHGFVPLDQEQ